MPTPGRPRGAARPESGRPRRRWPGAWLLAAALVLGLGACDDEAGGGAGDAGADDGLDTSWVLDLHDDTHTPQDTARTDAADTDEVLGGDVPGDGGDTAVIEGPPFDYRTWNISPATFPYGVQAGAMRADSVLLWSYITVPGPKHVRVWWEHPETEAGVLVRELEVAPDEDGYCQVAVDGLQAGTWYHYAFFDDVTGKRSIPGRVRTATPPGSLEPITVGVTVGTDWDHTPYEVLTLLSKEPLDLVLHLGDMSYNDHEGTAETLEEYRSKWLQTLDVQGYRDLLPTTGMIITWDDHEIANNFDPETLDPVRLAAGKQAFYDSLPVAPGPEGQLWTSYRWGDTVEFFVLDSRSERRPSTRESDAAEYISPAQMAWLQQGLLSSTCHFKVLLNSVPITDMPLAYDLAISDRWDGYASQRQELLAFLEANAVRNVWFVTGDFHVGFVARVEAAGYAHGIWEISAGPSGNGPNPLAFGEHPAGQFDWVGTSGEATTVLSFYPESDSVRVRFFDAQTDQLTLDAAYSAGE